MAEVSRQQVEINRVYGAAQIGVAVIRAFDGDLRNEVVAPAQADVGRGRAAADLARRKAAGVSGG